MFWSRIAVVGGGGLTLLLIIIPYDDCIRSSLLVELHGIGDDESLVDTASMLSISAVEPFTTTNSSRFSSI